MLLSTTSPAQTAYNVSFLGQVLLQTLPFYNFTNLPIFHGRDVPQDDVNQLYGFLMVNIPAAVYAFDWSADDGVWNILRNHIKDDTMSLVLCAGSEDTIWRVMDRRMRKLRNTRMIVLLKNDQEERPHMANRRLGRIMAKLWQLQFLQVVVIFNNSVYNYDPYPRISFYERIDFTVDPFPAVSSDLRGYVISTPVDNDIPRIFCVTNADGDLVEINGFAYHIFTNFLRRLNATFEISNFRAKRSITQNVNMSDILDRIYRQEIEITIHPYTGVKENEGIMGYPVFKALNCLIIPVRNEIPRYMYLLRPYDWQCWMLIAGSVVYVTVIVIWLNPWLRERELDARDRFSRGLLEGISQMLFLGSTFRMYDPGARVFFVYCLLAVMGFFTTAFYSNLLSSFLTTFLVGEQVDTFEQLIAARIPIMMKAHETSFVLQQVPPRLVRPVERLLVPVEPEVQVSHLLSFNTSYAYPVTEERWIFLALQQEHSNKPIYRFSRICFGMPLIGFPMRLDSHLELPMRRFILDIQMAGLDFYWLMVDFRNALRAGYVRLIDHVLPFKALDLDSLRVAWCVVTGGWTLSVIVFFFEILLYKRPLVNENLPGDMD